MKELSIEKKAKRYDKAIERAEGLIDFCSDSELKTLEYVFPELKERKDEKIRKVIYGWIYTQPSQFFDSGFSKEEILAWLEKQCQTFTKKDVDDAYLKGISETKNELEKQGEQKPIDVEEVNFFDDFRKTDSEVGPKFHEGDWTVSNLDGKARQISEVHFDEYNSYYVVNGQSVNLEEYDRLHHLWTIQDAKDGDVLVNDAGCIFIYKNYINNIVLRDYCHLATPGYIVTENDNEGGYIHITNVYPATKEQRDLLFQKMKEAGCEWDAEKKELKKKL